MKKKGGRVCESPGRPLALIRLANAAAQLVLRTQARRKEQGERLLGSPSDGLEGCSWRRGDVESGGRAGSYVYGGWWAVGGA